MLIEELKGERSIYKSQQEMKNKELVSLKNEVKELRSNWMTKRTEDELLRDEFERNGKNIDRLRKDNIELKTVIKEMEELNRKNENELDYYKRIEQSLKSSKKIELNTLFKENEGLRERERQLLIEKNQLEIVIQNMKVDNEKLVLEKGYRKDILGEELFENSKSRTSYYKGSTYVPIKEGSPVKDSLNNTNSNGLDKLGELDKIIQDFKNRRLNTFQ